MDLLSILFPKVRAEVLRLLFADPATELHLRELTRRTGLALGTVQVELAKLVAAGLVVAERDGNRRYFRAATGHPAFAPLQQLVLGNGDATHTAKSPKSAPEKHSPPITDNRPPATGNRTPLVLDLTRLD